MAATCSKRIRIPYLRALMVFGTLLVAANAASARTRPPTPTPTPELGMCYESSSCDPCDVYPCRPFGASREYCCQLATTIVGGTFSWCPADAFDPTDNSCTQCAYPCAAPTPQPTFCPQPTPEYLSVDPVFSPTDELTQTIVIRMGGGDRAQVTSEAGTFTFEGEFSREHPARITVTLVPNSANHLQVSAHVRPASQNGCPFGDYTLTRTFDLYGAPLTIVHGSARGPTIQVEPPRDSRFVCSGQFDIRLRSAGDADEPLEIDFIGLHHAYSQGDYGTGFSWDTSHLTLPLSLGAGEAVTIPVSYDASGQDFSSRLVLQVSSNARNNQETQYIPFFGRLCATPTPTPTSPFPSTPPPPTPTDSPDPNCPAQIILAPASGPPGTVVDLQGLCYRIHSGARAQVYLDDEPLLMVGGNTGGDYRALFVVPSQLQPGVHRVRVVTGQEIGSGQFEVTQEAGPCFGDCNDDEQVAVNELVTGVLISLGEKDVDTCASLDANNDGIISINEIVLAVNRVLGGCLVPPAADSLQGSYDLAFSDYDFGAPGSVLFDSGSVEADEDGIVVEFPFRNGMVRVSGTPAPDGSVALTGELVSEGGSPIPVFGYAITQKTTEAYWVTGELSVEDTIPATIRFSLSRPTATN